MADELHAPVAGAHEALGVAGLGRDLEAALVERAPGRPGAQQRDALGEDAAAGAVGVEQHRIGMADEERARLIGDVALGEAGDVDHDGVALAQRPARRPAALRRGEARPVQRRLGRPRHGAALAGQHLPVEELAVDAAEADRALVAVQPHVMAELAEHVALEPARDEQLRRELHRAAGSARRPRGCASAPTRSCASAPTTARACSRAARRRAAAPGSAGTRRPAARRARARAAAARAGRSTPALRAGRAAT